MNPAPIEPLVISVIDDAPEIVGTIALLLETRGHVVHRATEGKDALRLLDEVPCDVVLTDIVMPHVDGFELLLRARRLSPRPRVIAMTGGCRAMNADDAIRAALRLGASAALKKPFEFSELVEAIESGGKAVAVTT